MIKKIFSFIAFSIFFPLLPYDRSFYNQYPLTTILSNIVMTNFYNINNLLELAKEISSNPDEIDNHLAEKKLECQRAQNQIEALEKKNNNITLITFIANYATATSEYKKGLLSALKDFILSNRKVQDAPSSQDICFPLKKLIEDKKIVLPNTALILQKVLEKN